MKIPLCGHRQNRKVAVSEIGNLALSDLSFVSEIQIDRCPTVLLAQLVHLKDPTTWIESTGNRLRSSCGMGYGLRG